MECKSGLKKVSCLGREMIVVGIDLIGWIVRDIVECTPSTHTYVIVTDPTVASLGHLDKFTQQWNQFNSHKRLLAHVMETKGEESKCYEQKERVESWMIEQGCGRDSCLIALGGGVIGDLVGFIASTFMRGIPLFHIPTTLLAMVDSAIGGKNGINLPQGKNLIGTFYQPIKIYVDLTYLRTLPKREISNGMAEVIKAAIVANQKEFHRLERQSTEIWSQIAEVNDHSTQLLETVLNAIEFKARIVTLDEKEGGLRELLNFGHTIGHGIEGIFAPTLLHGECISIGMCREIEIGVNQGICPPSTLQRLQHVLDLYHLPTTLKFPMDLTKFMELVGADKKGRRGQKRLILLSGIGQTISQSASPVDDQDILRVISPSLKITRPLDTPPSEDISLAVPGSKSISNRALLLAALGQGPCDLDGLLHSEDTHWMTLALKKLTNRTFEFVAGGGNILRVGGATATQGVEFIKGPHEIYLGNCGTAARFLTSVCVIAARESGSPITLTGNKRMKERPIGPLVDALRNNGAKIDYLEKQGSLPLLIHPTQDGLRGGEVKVSAQLSSQYVSSLLMAAPLAATQDVHLILVGDKVPSQPYINITTEVMNSFGTKVTRLNETTYSIPKRSYINPPTYLVEGDASSATYPLAVAAITGSTVTVTNLGSKSLQGDAHFAKLVLEPMGCTVEQTEGQTKVKGPAVGSLRAIALIDMDTMTDAFLTASVLGAVAKGVTTIVGIGNARVKECDRIAVAVEQLKGFGVKAWEQPDGISIGPGIDPADLVAHRVDCWDDHRIAMAFSVLATIAPGSIILDKHCVVKSWPTYWNSFIASLHIPTQGIDLGTPNTSSGQRSHERDGSSVVLIGMKRVGKSSVGKEVAIRMREEFIDLDELIAAGVEIKQLIQNKGWEEFRKIEAQLLAQVLDAHPTGALIATGGGVVELESNRNKLKEWIKGGGVVIHVDSDWEILNEEFDSNVDVRIPYPNNESFMDVVKRRDILYQQSSNYSFINDKSRGLDSNVNTLKKLIQFARGQLRPVFPPLSAVKGQPMSRTFFLCLAVGSISTLRDKTGIMVLANGCRAIEIRVDHLTHPLTSAPSFKWTEQELRSFEKYVSQEVGVVMKEGGALPIIYTLRTQSEGGLIPDDINPSHLTSLYQLGIRLGCAYIDVQTSTQHLFTPLNKGRSKVIASYHGDIKWREPSAKEILNKCLAYGDVVKMVGHRDNEGCNQFVEQYYSSSPSIPLIGFNLRAKGALSRMRNPYMTPVTHQSIDNSAPGQLTLQQIHQGLTLLGEIVPKSYHLFGHQISLSKSPLIHNTLFASFGLPHHYSLCDTLDLDLVRKVMESPSFGGASVTMPLKEKVLSMVGSLSEAGRVIGAINTVARDSRTGVLIGDNTDWIGIKVNIQRALGQVGGAFTGKGALVLGAGGTSRAAIYALNKLHFDPIYVRNRSDWRVNELVESMGKNGIKINKIKDFVGLDEIGVVVDATPAIAKSCTLTLLSNLFPNNKKGIVVRLSYFGDPKYENPEGLVYVSPFDILIDQAVQQCIIWTQLQPSRQIITNALANANAKP